MKNIFRKNQVIITALAIMIAVAGYLNFTKDNVGDAFPGEGDAITTSSDMAYDITDNDEEDTLDLSSMESATDLSSNEKTEKKDNKKAEDKTKTEKIDVKDSGELAINTEKESTPGEAVLVNNTINSGFFSAAKIKREQTRAQNKEILMELVNSTNITEKQKQEAIDNIINMTAVSEKENAAETMLAAKGFDGAVVSIVDDRVDVVVNNKELTDQKIAQIEDIVKGKTGAAASNIVITPAEVAE